VAKSTIAPMTTTAPTATAIHDLETAASWPFFRAGADAGLIVPDDGPLDAIAGTIVCSPQAGHLMLVPASLDTALSFFAHAAHLKLIAETAAWGFCCSWSFIVPPPVHFRLFFLMLTHLKTVNN
jgi:hypothetical protein